MWRSLLAVVGILVASVGAATPTTDVSVHLDIEARTGTADSVLVFTSATLDCDGGSAEAGGFLRDVARRACTAARRGALDQVIGRRRRPRVCVEEYGGPQLARLTGRVGGRRVDISVSQADGCGTADWQTLRPLLGAPERLGRVHRPKHAGTPTTTAAPVVYHVKRGDTLTGIARQFHTTVGRITDANQLSDPDQLAEGQALTIPPASPVRLDVELPGDTTTGLHLTLLGGQPGEPVVFEIDAPDGSTFTGSPHVTAPDGSVTTDYTGEIGSGSYHVVARGDAGTEAELAFHVDPGRG